MVNLPDSLKRLVYFAGRGLPVPKPSQKAFPDRRVLAARQQNDDYCAAAEFAGYLPEEGRYLLAREMIQTLQDTEMLDNLVGLAYRQQDKTRGHGR